MKKCRTRCVVVHSVHDYTKLRAWEKARVLVRDIYKATAALPVEERYGLTSQIRRSAVSIVANIAEGAGRRTEGDFRRFIAIAAGSASELECELVIVEDLELMNVQQLDDLRHRASTVKRMLWGLRGDWTEPS